MPKIDYTRVELVTLAGYALNRTNTWAVDSEHWNEIARLGECITLLRVGLRFSLLVAGKGEDDGCFHTSDNYVYLCFPSNPIPGSRGRIYSIPTEQRLAEVGNGSWIDS